MGRRSVVVLVACAGCTLGGNDDSMCPDPSPNGEEKVLYVEGDGYVADGLYQHLIIPGYIPQQNFTRSGGTAIVFDPPVCERDAEGMIVHTEPGHLPHCWIPVHTEPTTTTCSIGDVAYDFVDATVDATGRGSHEVLAASISSTEAHVQVKCNTANMGADNDVTITIRGSNGKVRYKDRVELICQRADKFNVYWDEVVGRTTPPTLEGTVQVGEEFFVRYLMTQTQQSTQTDGPTLLGNGMLPVGSDPAFAVVGYEAFPDMAIRMRLKALKPATRPMISAGHLVTTVPVVITP